MEILKYLLLAVVQGLTETIPVSSSGHLMIIKKLISLGGNAFTTHFYLLLNHHDI